MNDKSKMTKPLYGYIYIITNDINELVYIGQTVNTIEQRFKKHCRKSAAQNLENSIDNAILIYGVDHFKVEEIERVPIDKLDEREIYWIKHYNSYKKGYNMTLGGQGSRMLTEEQIKEMISLYYSGVAIDEIREKTGISFSTLYHYLKSQEIPLRVRTEQQLQASIINAKKATLKRQIRIKNITLNKIYNSKKEALIDMIESGYSTAADWHNIRAPLDKALAKKQKTFLGFEWRYIDD